MADLRMTPQRRVILELLREARWHPTADELFEAVRRRLPRVSLATVYRNLEVLSQAGMIRRLQFSGGPRRFDGDTEKHAHVRCVRCGRLDDLGLDGPPLKEVLRSLPAGGETARNGFRITGHRIEFEGICPRCAFEHSGFGESDKEGKEGGGG